MRVGETVHNTLKGGWNKREGRGHKDLKKGGQARSRGGCLKRGGGGVWVGGGGGGGGGAGNPLRTMFSMISVVSYR